MAGKRLVERRRLLAPRAVIRHAAKPGLLARVGPGLISGASDVDPTTVATMAVVGATTVCALSWLAWLLFPMLAVVLVVATRVGAGSGRDLQTCVRDRYGPVFAWAVAGSIVVVNVLTIAADMHADGAAIGLLLTRHDSIWFTRPRRAGVYTATIAIATAVAVAMVVGLGVPVVRLLVIASVIGGMAAPIGLVALMLLSQDRRNGERRGAVCGGASWAARNDNLLSRPRRTSRSSFPHRQGQRHLRAGTTR